ncbi:MAG: hypothetical protein D6741_21595, partial [Planctomycetota bacterium]
MVGAMLDRSVRGILGQVLLYSVLPFDDRPRRNMPPFDAKISRSYRLRIVAATALGIAWIAGVLLYRGVIQAEFALPVAVQVELAAPTSPFDVQLIHVYRSGHAETVEPSPPFAVSTTVVWPEVSQASTDAASGTIPVRESAPNSWFREAYAALPSRQTFRWQIRHRWVKELYLAVSPNSPRLREVTLQIGRSAPPT